MKSENTSNYNSINTIKTTETETLKQLNSEEKNSEITETEKSSSSINKDNNNRPVEITIINDEMIGLEFPYLDEMINKKGMKSLQFKSLLISGMIYFLEGIHSSLSGLLFIPILTSYKLSTFIGCLISSSLVFCMAFGALIAGSFSQIKGRKMTIVIFLLVISISTTFSIIQHPIILLITRSINGFSLGVILPICTNHLIEVLPKKFRSFWVISLSFFFSLGGIFSSQIMKSCHFNFKIFFFSLSIPSTIIMILFTCFYDDNPRYLILHGKHEEGIKIIEKYYKNGNKIDETEKQEIIRNVDKGINKEVMLIGKHAFVFKRYKRITIILIFVWILYSFMVNGGALNIMLGNSMAAGYIYEEDFSDEEFTDVIDVIEVLYVIFAIIYLITGLISEIKICGRKKLIFCGFLFSFLIQILLLIFGIENLVLIYFIGFLFINICFNIINTYSMEVYPTRVRDSAMGFLTFISRISGFISNFVTIIIIPIWTSWIFYFSLVVSFFGLIVTCLLPFDTYNRELDSKLPEKKKKPIERTNEEMIIQIK